MAESAISVLLTEQASERVRRAEERAALFGERYGTTRDDIAGLISDDVKPYQLVDRQFVGGRSSGKTFSSMEALRKIMEDARSDLFKVKDSTISIDGTQLKDTKFDISSFLTSRPAPKDTYYITPQHQYTHTVTVDPSYIKNYYNFMYGTQPPSPSLKDLASKYLGFGKQVQAATESVEKVAEHVGENPRTKVFVYSERTNRMYKDRMRFWLTNPFKDDILACAETNS